MRKNGRTHRLLGTISENRGIVILGLLVFGILVILVSPYIFPFSFTVANTESNRVYMNILDKDGMPMDNWNIATKSGQRVDFGIEFASSSSPDKEYLVKIFNGNEFIEFSMDGISGSEQYITLLKRSKKSVSVGFTPQPNAGLNNYEIMLIQEPDKNMSFDQRLDGAVYVQRFSIAIDSEKSIKEPKFDVHPYIRSQYMTFSQNMMVTENKVNNQFEKQTNVKTPYSNSIFLNMQSDSRQTQYYKLVCLVDWKVKKIFDNDNLLFYLMPDQAISIPMNLNLTADDVGKDMMFLLISNPNESMDDKNLEKLLRANASYSVENSARIKIVN